MYSNLQHRFLSFLAAALVLSGVVPFLAQAGEVGPIGTWTQIANMSTSRRDHTAIALADGRVLVTGGFDYTVTGSAVRSAEVWNPSTGAWTTTWNMFYTRMRHGAVLLTNGKVLVAGGDNGGTTTRSAELWDPRTGAWSLTGSMLTPRSSMFDPLPLVRLQDGRVLVAGGWSPSGRTALAELYNPATGTWSATGSMHVNRAGHTATLMSDGRVLVAGGEGACPPYPCDSLASAEVYDPATGTWSLLPDMSRPRTSHSAAALPNGGVIVIGGYACTELGDIETMCTGIEWTPTTEIFDPALGMWRPGAPMSMPRGAHATASFPGGVLVSGGVYGLGSADVYDTFTGEFTPTPPPRPRVAGRAVTLRDGRVLVVGGSDEMSGRGSNSLATADLYTPLLP